MLLLHPPFAPAENAGYIGAYIPGVRENGGQYTHAVPWLVQALAHIGAYDTAWEIARALLPLFHTDTPQGLHTYKTEPYVLCGDVYAGENPGRGGWSWYTGSALWYFRVVTRELLGLTAGQGGEVKRDGIPLDVETLSAIRLLTRLDIGPVKVADADASTVTTRTTSAS